MRVSPWVRLMAEEGVGGAGTGSGSSAQTAPTMAEAAAAQAQFDKTGVTPSPAAKPGGNVQKNGNGSTPAAGKIDKPAATEQKPAAGGIGAIKAKPDKPGAPEDEAEKQRLAKEAAAKGGKEGGKEGGKVEELTRWKELKAAETELNELKPKWDASQKEREKWEADKAEWEKERKELETLRRERDFTDFTKMDAYKKEVEAPYQKIMQTALDVAEYAKVDVKELVKAMNEPNPLKRAKDIKTVLEGGKEEIADVSDLVRGGTELQEIFKKHDEFQVNASQLKEQHENGKKAEKLKADTEALEITKKAHREIQDILRAKASDVLDDDTLKGVLERATAQNSDDPMDRAFRGQAEFLVPALIEKNRALKLELETLKGEKEAETAAKPGIKPEAGKPGKEAPYGSLKEATSAHKAAGGHF